MYLNKTAELTEQIILVPHIIEMSCRITQRKGDKDAFLQTPEMSLASFAFFFHFQTTELQSRQGATES